MCLRRDSDFVYSQTRCQASSRDGKRNSSEWIRTIIGTQQEEKEKFRGGSRLRIVEAYLWRRSALEADDGDGLCVLSPLPWRAHSIIIGSVPIRFCRTASTGVVEAFGVA